MWTSPSDWLRGKVALAMPFTRKFIQAKTHQGILNIGGEIENKFLQEHYLDKESALANQKKALLDSFDTFIMVQVKDVEARERAACQREIDKLTEEFEHRIVQELDDLEASLRVEYKGKFKGQRKSLQIEWANLMNHRVSDTVKKITSHFLKEMKMQKEIFKRECDFQMCKAEMRKEYSIHMEKIKCKERTEELCQELECKHFANMMYLLCSERRKCKQEKTSLENEYLNKMKEMKDISVEEKRKITELKDNITNLNTDLHIRESCVLKIIKEFQKFINYVLKSSPTQAEFLLSTERMLQLELKDVSVHIPVKKEKLCHNVSVWKNPEKMMSDIDTDDALVINDYHDCLNELWPPMSKDQQFLPAFYYNNKLYVREDFRNMISNGIRISPSDELWNEDVDEVADIIQKSTSTLASLDENKKKAFETTSFSSILKKCKKRSFEWRGPGGTIYDEGRRRSSLKPTYYNGPIDYSKLCKNENSPLILAARSSLDIMKEKIPPEQLRRTVPSETPQGTEEKKESEDDDTHTLIMQEIRESLRLKKPPISDKKLLEVLNEKKALEVDKKDLPSDELKKTSDKNVETEKICEPKCLSCDGEKKRKSITSKAEAHAASKGKRGTIPIQKNRQSQTSKEKKNKYKLLSQQTTEVGNGFVVKVHSQELGSVFYDNRIRSLISMIRNRPDLLRTFTACQK